MRIFKTISTTATTTETAPKAPKSDHTKIGHEIEDRKKKIQEKRKCTNEIWLFLKDLTNRLNRVGLSIWHRLMVSLFCDKNERRRKVANAKKVWTKIRICDYTNPKKTKQIFVRKEESTHWLYNTQTYSYIHKSNEKKIKNKVRHKDKNRIFIFVCDRCDGECACAFANALFSCLLVNKRVSLSPVMPLCFVLDFI